jgi:hypothetical protein
MRVVSTGRRNNRRWHGSLSLRCMLLGSRCLILRGKLLEDRRLILRKLPSSRELRKLHGSRQELRGLHESRLSLGRMEIIKLRGKRIGQWKTRSGSSSDRCGSVNGCSDSAH